MKRVILPILILGVAILMAAVLVRTPPQVVESAVEVRAVTVRVAEVRRETIQLSVESQGKVQAAQTASLSAPVAGPIAWISPSLEAGGYLQEGETLLRLDTSDFETVLARSRAALQQTQAEANHAANELSRLEDLAQQRLVSDSQLQDAKRSADVSASRLTDAQASYDQAELDLQRAEIKAPFNAIVATKEVELGQYVNRAESIAVLFGADVVDVRVPLAIRQLGYLDFPLGVRGELPADQAPDVIVTGMYGGQEHHWQGKLVRTEAAIDANSNTVQTIIRVSQPEGGDQLPGYAVIPLPIGLYVQAEIQGKQLHDIIALPRKVIRNNNQVLVVDAENKMHYRDVEIFRLEEDRVLISGGLEPGERICTSPIQAVTEGMLVEPILELI